MSQFVWKFMRCSEQFQHLTFVKIQKFMKLKSTIGITQLDPFVMEGKKF